MSDSAITSTAVNFSWTEDVETSSVPGSADFSWKVVVVSDEFEITDVANFAWDAYELPVAIAATPVLTWASAPPSTNLEFGEAADPPSSDDVNLDFGGVVVGDPVFLDSSSEAGEEFAVGGLYVAKALGEIAFTSGESLGDFFHEFKDLRNNPSVTSLPLPYSLGLSFLASSQGTWPPAYTLSGQYRHFYSSSFGTPLSISVSSPLVLPAVVSMVELFGTGNGFYPIYSTTSEYIGATSGEAISIGVSLQFVGVGSNAGAGEALSWTLATVRQLSIEDFTAGETLSFNLAIESTQIEGAVGENFTASLDVYDLVGASLGVGDTIEASLSTLPSLIFSISAGESATSTPEWHAASYFSIALSTGEGITATIATGSTFEVEWGFGSSIDAGFSTPSRADMTIQGWTGSTFTPVYLQTSFSLGSIQIATGVQISVLSVDEVSNYRAANGEALEATLEATQSMSAPVSTGERLSLDLTPAPGGELAVRLYDGSNFVQSSMDVLEAIYLHCNLFTGVWVQATESTASTSFDLEGPPMYHNTLDWWLEANQFEFIDLPPSFVYGTGAGVVVKADLSTRPRFTIAFTTGESFSTVSQSRYIEDVALQFGTLDLPREYLYVEPHINLCYPNVFPLADNMEVELDFNEDSCYTDMLMMGENVSFKVSATFGLQIPLIATGEMLTTTLTTYGIWAVRFSHGQALITTLGTTASMELYVRTGEVVQETFEEPSVLFYCGESFEATLQTTFDVEFTERGCLDNEYVYMTETGDEDKDKFSPAAVELAPFSHDIKARCF